ALGNVKLHQRDFAGALTDYQRAAKFAPLWADANASCALVLQLLGHTDQANSTAMVALVLDPNHSVALKVMASIHIDARRFEAAVQCAERVLKQSPTDPDALAFQAQCACHRMDVRVGLSASADVQLQTEEKPAVTTPKPFSAPVQLAPESMPGPVLEQL